MVKEIFVPCTIIVDVYTITWSQLASSRDRHARSDAVCMADLWLHEAYKDNYMWGLLFSSIMLVCKSWALLLAWHVSLPGRHEYTKWRR